MSDLARQTLDDLMAERRALVEAMAADYRQRTDENFRRRDSLDRKIRRWRRDGTPGTKRYGYRMESSGVSRNDPGSATNDTGDDALRLCAACGEPLPEFHAGRKVRADAVHCPGSNACRQAAYRARKRAIYGGE